MTSQHETKVVAVVACPN